MEEPQTVSAKSISNQKYKKKQHGKKVESFSRSTAAVEGNVPNPQPQRLNRRQRTEAHSSPNDASSSPVIQSSPASSIDNKDTPKIENVTVDFSNLKRETEEIEKLNKKFAKRNITSNWHRYSTPEVREDNRKEEEEVPADFSALIQVPSSKGGHLQLKDEQEWSSASSEMLGGLFALNLNQLSESLACIPLYEQLRLPKEMFTEEELKHFDNLASDAKKVCNGSNANKNPNSLVLSTLSKILTDHEDIEYQQNDFIDDFKVVNFDERNQNSTKMNLHEQLSTETHIIDDLPLSSTNQHSQLSSQLKEIYNFKKDLSVSIEDIENSLSNAGKNLDLDNTPLIEINSKNLKSSYQSPEDIDEINQNKTSEPKDDKDFIPNKMISIESVRLKKDELSLIQSNEVSSEMVSVVQGENKNSTSNSERNTEKLSGIRQSDIKNTFNVDDEDLDILLSLKKPATQEPKPNTSTISKIGGVLPSKTSSQHPSDLDDWLDSVLQD